MQKSLILAPECLTLIIQQHVLWFEVSVDDPLLVEMLHALDDLSSVVAGSWLIEPGVVLVHIVNVIPGWIRDYMHFLKVYRHERQERGKGDGDYHDAV